MKSPPQMEVPQVEVRKRSFWKPFWILSGVGFVGIISLYPTLGPAAEAALQRPEVPDLPIPVLKILLLGNPILFLLVSAAVGSALAPRLGLRSHLAEKASTGESVLPHFRNEITGAVAWGLVAGILILFLDPLLRTFLGDSGEILSALEGAQTRTGWFTVAGMLYGGITEEVMMRWGLVSFLAWIPWRVFQRGEGRPRAWILWVAIIIAAILFGLGHIPALAAQTTVTPAVFLRIVGLNAVGGLIFGWLFWKRSLEAAMLAHGSAHVFFSLATWGGAIIS